MKFLYALVMGISTVSATFAADVPIMLVVNPTNLVLRPAQPTVFDLELRNRSDACVRGVFVRLKDGFAGLSIEITDPSGNHYLFAHDEVVDDIVYNEVVLNPGEVMRSSTIILYDMVKRCHVFTQGGEYTISFFLRWKWGSEERYVTKTTVSVKVVNWDGESEQPILAAMELWMDRGIAIALQTDAELNESSLARLRRLVEEYPETVYGKLALDLLKRVKKP